MRPRALDLFSGAGGATKGLQRAGFHVTGVDLFAQPRYCGDAFIQADALSPPVDLREFDFIWASPICQADTAMKTMHNAKHHERLIEPTRALLIASGVPYAIENVEGAPLINPVTLCGTQFGLWCDEWELRRHRPIETSFPVLGHPCDHKRATLGIYGGHVRDRRRRPGSHARGLQDPPIAVAHRLMEINWMTLQELSQAIPPAYSEFIGRRALAWMRAAA
jgi:DNA (cytosine-5)-methyltransferase 1